MKRSLKKLLAASAVGALGVLGVGLINPPAAFAVCGQANPGFSQAGTVHWQFSPSTVTKQIGTCNDFNLGPTESSHDNFRGWYKSGTTWKAGAAGWKYVSTNTAVLVSNVVAGTSLKAEAWLGGWAARELF